MRFFRNLRSIGNNFKIYLFDSNTSTKYVYYLSKIRIKVCYTSNDFLEWE